MSTKLILKKLNKNKQMTYENDSIVTLCNDHTLKLEKKKKNRHICCDYALWENKPNRKLSANERRE